MATARRVVRRSSGTGPTPSKKAAPVAPTRARDDDDEDDEVVEEADVDDAAAIRAGWGAAEETMDSTSTFAQNFKLTAQTQIVRFLEDKPYASFRRHWVERPQIGTRAYTCLETVDRECPLCNIGDRVQAVSSFNIAVIADDGTVSHKSWDSTPTVTKPLQTLARDQKIGPLNRKGLYFACSKPEAKRKFDRVTPLISPVRERDLEEDYGVKAPSEAGIAKAMKALYTNEIVQIPKGRELQEIVDELMNDESGGQKSWDKEEEPF